MAAPFHALQMKASHSCKIQVLSCGLPRSHDMVIFQFFSRKGYAKISKISIKPFYVKSLFKYTNILTQRRLRNAQFRIPNHRVFGDACTNSSVRPNRRLDIDFFIPYKEDVERVVKTVDEILQEEDIVLDKPAPRVVIDQFTPDYMAMKARFWVQRKNALTVRWGLNAKLKTRFDELGISMTSTRLEVNLRPNQAEQQAY
jgi:small-conductance mechanosensitive channel